MKGQKNLHKNTIEERPKIIFIWFLFVISFWLCFYEKMVIFGLGNSVLFKTDWVFLVLPWVCLCEDFFGPLLDGVFSKSEKFLFLASLH